MHTKDGKFYADWRDRSGRRIRKSFTSKRAALQHEAEQKELAHPKPRVPGKLSLISSSPRCASARTNGIGKQPAKPSSLPLAQRYHPSSSRRTPRKPLKS
jgi:hypothetical protein